MITRRALYSRSARAARSARIGACHRTPVRRGAGVSQDRHGCPVPARNPPVVTAGVGDCAPRQRHSYPAQPTRKSPSEQLHQRQVMVRPRGRCIERSPTSAGNGPRHRQVGSRSRTIRGRGWYGYSPGPDRLRWPAAGRRWPRRTLPTAIQEIAQGQVGVDENGTQAQGVTTSGVRASSVPSRLDATRRQGRRAPRRVSGCKRKAVCPGRDRFRRANAAAGIPSRGSNGHASGRRQPRDCLFQQRLQFRETVRRQRDEAEQMQGVGIPGPDTPTTCRQTASASANRPACRWAAASCTSCSRVIAFSMPDKR